MSKSIFEMLQDIDAQHEADEARPDRGPIIKPPFGWPGGKSKCIDKILPMLPRTPTYVEVFGGSAAVLLCRTKSKLEVFNDRFAGVTDFYRCVRDHALKQKLKAWLDQTVHSREEWARCHDTWEDMTDPVERAGRWFYQTCYSFSGLGRSFGRATTAEGGGAISGKVSRNVNDLDSIQIRMRDVLIENLDFRLCIKDFDRDDAVFYLDPPYMGQKNTHYKFGMTENDHEELLHLVKNCKGFVALSGYDNDMYNSQKFWTNKISWKQRVTIAGNTQNNNKGAHSLNDKDEALECLWIKDFA